MKNIVSPFLFAVLFITGCSSGQPNPVVIMDTSMGPIKVELFANQAPITVQNFLQYVDDKFYDGTIFHRVIPDFMVQGGGFEPGMQEKKTRGTIKNESFNGIANTTGNLAMARTPHPDSATAQFFINVKDNTFLDRANAQDRVGYAVFGKVIEGMDVVNKIRRVETGTKEDKITHMKHDDVPEEDVLIKSIRRVEIKKES